MVGKCETEPVELIWGDIHTEFRKRHGMEMPIRSQENNSKSNATADANEPGSSRNESESGSASLETGNSSLESDATGRIKPKPKLDDFSAFSLEALDVCDLPYSIKEIANNMDYVHIYAKLQQPVSIR